MTERPSRRGFLGALAASTLAAGSAGLGDDEPRRERKFTMDLNCGNLGVRANQLEAIGLAHKYGFESVAPDAGYLTGLSDERRHDVLAELNEKGLVWGATGLPLDFRGDDARFRSELKGLPNVARALERARVERVGTWVRPTHEKLTYSANFRRHAERLRAVAEVLGDHGLRLGLEYVGPKTSWSSARYPFIHTMAEMKELIAEIGRDDVGLVLDSWHWYTAGETEADLKTLANRDVVACDLNDAPAGLPADRQVDSVRDLPCATGVIDLKAFLNALVAIGYDGPVRAEPFKADLRALPKDQAVAVAAKAMKKAFALIG
jgi:sugar phosphate isomerase/epimerase